MMKFFVFLMQDETLPISHAGWEFSDFSCRMRLFSFLIEDEIFTYSHSRWDFPNFSCRMRLFGFLMLHETFCPRYEKQKQKKTTLLRPLHYVLAVKNTYYCLIRIFFWSIETKKSYHKVVSRVNKIQRLFSREHKVLNKQCLKKWTNKWKLRTSS